MRVVKLGREPRQLHLVNLVEVANVDLRGHILRLAAVATHPGVLFSKSLDWGLGSRFLEQEFRLEAGKNPFPGIPGRKLQFLEIRFLEFQQPLLEFLIPGIPVFGIPAT